MSAPDISMELLRKFNDSEVNDHATILLGAGASVSSGLPDWNKFAQQLLTESKAIDDDNLAERFVQFEDPLLVAEAAQAATNNRTSHNSWNAVVRRALFKDVNDVSPSSLHLAVANYILYDESHQSRVATLNFDTLIEQSINEACKEERSHPVVEPSPSDGEYDVRHLHGFITSERAESIVLTLSDVTDASSHEVWQRDYLRDALKKGPLIIAGTSYRDPDVRQWLQETLRQPIANSRRPSVFVLLAREGFNLSHHDFQRIRLAVELEWESIGIQPLLVEDFADVAQIIFELRSVVQQSYLSPQERAVQIWEYHAKNFNELQEVYSEQLSQDARKFSEILDDDSINLTLWLADGQGNLGRWASQDRIFRNIGAIRRIRSGYDSPLIAGKTLSRESTLFQDLPIDSGSHWQSVLAAPITVSYGRFQPFTDAVLSIGLPRSRSDYKSTSVLWNKVLSDVANQWSTRLAENSPTRLASTGSDCTGIVSHIERRPS